jgi:hypothetical protein
MKRVTNCMFGSKVVRVEPLHSSFLELSSVFDR